ncbi:MAG: PKD domain-containing protein [Chitinophagaceae bacterium]|nr:PKD domain-containing protein [Chitinophagaceae bacterium]
MSKKVSSFFRIDEQVFFTMAGVSLLAIIILAFRFTTDRPCAPVKIKTGTGILTEGVAVRLKAETERGESYSWNFGDGTTSEDATPSTSHIFKQAGRYIVSVIVNGTCVDMQNIVISESAVVVNTSLHPLIIGSDTAYVNEALTFADASATSTSWEWRFGETGIIDSYDKTPTYTYTTAGVKKISLKVNGRPDLVVQKWIYVIDKEAQKAAMDNAKADATRRKTAPPIVFIPSAPTAPPLTNQQSDPVKKEEPKAPSVTADQLRMLLFEVVEGTKRAEDFSEYLCGNLSREIVYNGSPIAFNKMCEDLKGIKKKRINKISVVPYRNGQTNCIESMSVTVDKKKGIFGL